MTQVAQTGSGPAAHVLARFGLDAQELAKQDPSQTFIRLMGALEKVQNPMERMKDTMDLFGRGGGGLVNMAAQGSERLKELMADAEKTGVAFSNIDAAKVREANVAMNEIWESVAGVGNSLAIELAPWIHEVAGRFGDWAKIWRLQGDRAGLERSGEHDPPHPLWPPGEGHGGRGQEHEPHCRRRRQDGEPDGRIYRAIAVRGDGDVLPVGSTKRQPEK